MGTFTPTTALITSLLVAATLTGAIILSGQATVNFKNTGLVIRNVLSSFAYTIAGGAITANQTVNLPVVTQTETLAVVPHYNFTSPTNQTGTTSGSSVMLGAVATFYTKTSTNATITVSGYATSGTLLDGCRVDVRTSTSYMGGNGAAVAGTLLGSNLKITSATANANVPFSKTVIATGLTTGTKNFVDLSQAALIGGTCTIFNVDWYIMERQ